MKKNIVLIGMPGVGKSSIGVVLAKAIGYSFLDSDLLIQEKDGRLLHEIVEQEGHQGFIDIEEKVNSQIDVNKTIIATGGSVIYGTKAMEHLSDIGVIVYLKATYETILSRVTNIVGRGVTMPEGMTFEDLYYERIPLYEKYAQITVEVDSLTIEKTVHTIKDMLEKM